MREGTSSGLLVAMGLIIVAALASRRLQENSA